MIEALGAGLRLVATLDLGLWQIVGLSLAVSLSAVALAALVGLPRDDRIPAMLPAGGAP